MSVITSATTKITLSLTAEQVEMLKLVLGQVVKPAKGRKADAVKVKRTGSLPKGQTPPHLVKWNTYVDTVEAELKGDTIESVWKQWTATNPMSKPRKGSDAEPVSLVTDEKRASFKVIRQVAMRIAKARKEAGLMPAQFQHTPMTDEEKATAKAARASAAASASASALVSAAEESATETKKVRKPRVAKPKAAPAPAPVEEEVEVALEDFTFKGRKYLRLASGECWVRNADGNRGKWAGKYDSVKDKIDTSATEPKVEE